MAQKGQDSTPKHLFWQEGEKNVAYKATTWGYDSVLVGLRVDKGITAGVVSFEGFLGMTPLEDPEAKWGDWYTLSARPVNEVRDATFFDHYELSNGSVAFRVNVTGFSEFRIGLLEPLAGEGQVQVASSSHAFA